MGRKINNLLLEFARLHRFLMRFFREVVSPPFEFKEIIRQCYEVGWKSFPLISLTGFIVGFVFTKQSRPSLEEFGATSWLPALISIAIVRALAPLVTALIASGKVGSQIGAELSSMNVTEQIDAFEKLKFESQFQELSPGGAISYVEVPNMQDNLDAVISVMQYIYDNIMYAELNTKSDFCMECGYTGEIQIITDPNGKLIWECPECGNKDQDKMNVARRTCGYIGTQFWNQGRTQEIKERVLHL